MKILECQKLANELLSSTREADDMLAALRDIAETSPDSTERFLAAVLWSLAQEKRDRDTARMEQRERGE